MAEVVSLPAAATATVILSLVIIIGNSGSLLFFIVFCKTRRLRTRANAFHVSVTVSNVIACNVVAPAVIALMWQPDMTLPLARASCHVSPWLVFTFISVLSSHVGLACLRCVKVYRPTSSFRRGYVIVGLVTTWATAFGTQAHMMLTNTGIIFTMGCDYAALLSESSVFVTTTIYFVLCFVSLVTCYTLIAFKITRCCQPQVAPEVPAVNLNQPPANVAYVQDNQPDGEQPADASAANHAGIFDVKTVRTIVKANLLQLGMFLMTGGVALVCTSVARSKGFETSAAIVINSVLFIAYSFNPLVYGTKDNELKKIIDRFRGRVN